jgi:saccharopine dehydrogenase-like NADP-dependent oxidoreductase
MGMKKVLILGAGMVAQPLVDYLANKGYALTVCDLNASAAANVVKAHKHATSHELNIEDSERVNGLIVEHDLTVSLLPPPFHPKIARICLDYGKHFVSASYLSEDMLAMHEEAKAKGLVFINELGLDPGLDHMTAMEMVDEAKRSGYKIEAFESHCGGIPSRKAANNTLRYKFSWSPRGVLSALTRASRYRKNNELVEVPGDRKLEFAAVVEIPGAGIFESSPNADGLYYAEQYGIEDTPTVYRGTLRYPGWAQFWLFMLRQGFLDQNKKRHFQGKSALKALLILAGKDPNLDIIQYVREEARSHASVFLEHLHKLGFLNPKTRVTGEYSAFDIILLQAQATMQYEDNEADYVVLHHVFRVSKDGKREQWSSTLLQEGDEETTAMATLVGTPCAIAVRLILEDKMPEKGVMIPLHPEVYGPILAEMEAMGIHHEVIKQVLK